MYIYTPLCRYWITLYRYVLVFIVPHVDIKLEDNKQFISNIPRMCFIQQKVNMSLLISKCRSNLEVPLTFTILWAVSADKIFDDTNLTFSIQQNLLETICMKCQILFLWKIIQNVVCWNLMLSTLWAISADTVLMIFFWSFLSRKQNLTVPATYL